MTDTLLESLGSATISSFRTSAIVSLSAWTTEGSEAGSRKADRQMRRAQRPAMNAQRVLRKKPPPLSCLDRHPKVSLSRPRARCMGTSSANRQGNRLPPARLVGLHLYTTLAACVSAGAEGQPAPESWPSVAAIYWHGIANFRQRLPLWRRSCTHPHFSSGFPLSPLLFFSHHSPSI